MLLAPVVRARTLTRLAIRGKVSVTLKIALVRLTEAVWVRAVTVLEAGRAGFKEIRGQGNSMALRHRKHQLPSTRSLATDKRMKKRGCLQRLRHSHVRVAVLRE